MFSRADFELLRVRLNRQLGLAHDDFDCVHNQVVTVTIVWRLSSFSKRPEHFLQSVLLSFWLFGLRLTPWLRFVWRLCWLASVTPLDFRESKMG